MYTRHEIGRTDRPFAYESTTKQKYPPGVSIHLQCTSRSVPLFFTSSLPARQLRRGYTSTQLLSIPRNVLSNTLTQKERRRRYRETGGNSLAHWRTPPRVSEIIFWFIRRLEASGTPLQCRWYLTRRLCRSMSDWSRKCCFIGRTGHSTGFVIYRWQG